MQTTNEQNDALINRMYNASGWNEETTKTQAPALATVLKESIFKIHAELKACARAINSIKR